MPDLNQAHVFHGAQSARRSVAAIALRGCRCRLFRRSLALQREAPVARRALARSRHVLHLGTVPVPEAVSELLAFEDQPPQAADFLHAHCDGAVARLRRLHFFP